MKTTSVRARKAALSRWCAFEPRMVGSVDCKESSTTRK
jgi:hypothetical protein